MWVARTGSVASRHYLTVNAAVRGSRELRVSSGFLATCYVRSGQMSAPESAVDFFGETCGPVHSVSDSRNGCTERKLVAERFYAAARQE